MKLPVIQTMLLWILFGHAVANAEAIIDVIETGDRVIFQGAGTFNLAALEIAPIPQSFVNGYSGVGFNSVLLGPRNAVPADSYWGEISAPSSIAGRSSFAEGFGAGGDRFGASQGGEPVIIVPDGYKSGGDLSSSMTYIGETLDSLKLNVGTYVWTWGSDENADSLILNIVPEPSTDFHISFWLACLLACRRKRNEGSTSNVFR